MRLPYLGLKEALREEHDKTNQLKVRNNTDNRTKQCLHRLWQLCASSIPRVHSNEDTHLIVQGNLLPFKLKIKINSLKKLQFISFLKLTSKIFMSLLICQKAKIVFVIKPGTYYTWILRKSKCDLMNIILNSFHS